VIPVLLIRRGGFVFDQSWAHESRRPARQVSPRFHTKLAQKRRDMELNCTDRYIQLRRDFLVSSIAQHSVQYFALPGAERRWARDRAPFPQQFLRAGNQAIHQRTIGGHHHLKFRRILASHQALHRQESCDPLDRAL
jgi:hypothetical protein